MKWAVVTLATDDLMTRDLAAALANGLLATGRTGTLVWVLESHNRYVAPPLVSDGVDILTIDATDLGQPWFLQFPLLNVSRPIASRVRDFDIVFGMTAGHPLMHAIRESRHSPSAVPYFVAILDHSLQPDRGLGLSAAEVVRDFGEKYVLTYCDMIAQRGITDLRSSASLGVTPPPSRMVAFSNQSLPMLFDHIETRARAVVDNRAERPRRPREGVKPPLTIFVSYSERSGDPTRVLHALDRQSRSDFSVVVIDSNSLTKAGATLAQLIDTRRERGWAYRHEPQCGEARAIARSIASTTSEYLMFIDTEDAPEPHLVARSLEAAEVSSDDLLELWSTKLPNPNSLSRAGNDRPPIPTIRASYGLDLINAMGEDDGNSSLFLVRRHAFEAVGGYPTALIAGGERRALALKVALAGFSCDVLPEILNVRREHDDVFSRDKRRDGESRIRAFDERLNAINMQTFAMSFNDIAREARVKTQAIESRQRELARRFAIPAAKERLRLLMVTPSFPYPPASDDDRRWQTIQFLGQRHDLTLATFCSSEQSRQRSALLRYCRSIYAAAEDSAKLQGFDNMPHAVSECMRSSMREALRAIPTHLYDVALIDSDILAPFSAEIDAPAMLGVDGAKSRAMMRSTREGREAPQATDLDGLRREAELMRDYENEVWPKFAMRSAISAGERDEIQRRAKIGRTVLVEQGVRSDLWLANARQDTERLVFFGNLGNHAHIDGILHFWQDIFPHIVRRRPSLELTAAGNNATSELRNLVGQPGFVLIENPRDLREVAATASLSIVPLRLDPGTNHGILESMALGLPVVTTSIGCAGLSVEDGEHLMVRDSTVEFAEAVNELLSTHHLWELIRYNAKALIETRYKWETVLAPLESGLWTIAR